MAYRVYLIDDEKWVLDDLIDRIEWLDNGFTVAGFNTNPLLALEEIKALRPDVVITDLKMPIMDGLKLTKTLKSAGVNSKIVMLTAVSEAEATKIFYENGGYAYALKPFERYGAEALLERLYRSFPQDSHSSPLDPLVPSGNPALDEITAYIASHCEEPHTLKSLSGRWRIPQDTLSRMLAEHYHSSLAIYIKNLRMQEASRMLQEADIPVKAVGALCGYPDYMRFARVFAEHFGTPPSEYRKTALPPALEYTRRAKAPRRGAARKSISALPIAAAIINAAAVALLIFFAFLMPDESSALLNAPTPSPSITLPSPVEKTLAERITDSFVDADRLFVTAEWASVDDLRDIGFEADYLEYQMAETGGLAPYRVLTRIPMSGAASLSYKELYIYSKDYTRYQARYLINAIPEEAIALFEAAQRYYDENGRYGEVTDRNWCGADGVFRHVEAFDESIMLELLSGDGPFTFISIRDPLSGGSGFATILQRYVDGEVYLILQLYGINTSKPSAMLPAT